MTNIDINNYTLSINSQTFRGSKRACKYLTSGSLHETCTNRLNPSVQRWNEIKSQWNRLIAKINRHKPAGTDKNFNIRRIYDNNVEELLGETIGEKPYRIATAGYSFGLDGYERPSKAFLSSIDSALGRENTGYVFPPSLDKGTIYDISAQISGLNKDKSLFITAEEFLGFLDLKKFSTNINIDTYIKKPIYVFPTIREYISATADVSNTLVCTGGRTVAISEISEALKRNHKVVLLLNFNLNNGTYNNAQNKIENAAKFFDRIRVSDIANYSKQEQHELKSLLKDKDKINRLVRIYLASDEKSAAEAGIRAAEFIKNSESTTKPSFSDISKAERLLHPPLYQLKKFPQEILRSPIREHIHPINWSTINPKTGVIITQNESINPIIVRKVVTDGTLLDSLVTNNSNRIPLQFDIVKDAPYIHTRGTKQQLLTGDSLMAIYPHSVKRGKSMRLQAKDCSFVPADIVEKQYEIVTKSGQRIPCNYKDMVAGVDYKICKKGGVELKMAVPPTEVINSEGEVLPAGKLYMVNSMGHFYDGQPIRRIMNGEVTWNANMNDRVQAQIRNDIDEAIRLRSAGEHAKSKELMAKAEQEMTEWVKVAQNKNNEDFLV